jgi:hypothetical protein
MRRIETINKIEMLEIIEGIMKGRKALRYRDHLIRLTKRNIYFSSIKTGEKIQICKVQTDEIKKLLK